MVDSKENDKFDMWVKVFIKTEINGHPSLFLVMFLLWPASFLFMFRGT